MVNATVTDAVSGPANPSASAAASTSAVGTHSVEVTGRDVAGRIGRADCAYKVIFNFNGFFQPVDMGGVYNVAKAGSAIPVKFNLGGDQGLNIFETGYPKVSSVACPSSALTSAIEETVAATTSGLKYDAVASQYNYTWKTGSWAGTCRRLEVKLVDGQIHEALFRFNK